jgi:hypothetical protein
LTFSTISSLTSGRPSILSPRAAISRAGSSELDIILITSFHLSPAALLSSSMEETRHLVLLTSSGSGSLTDTERSFPLASLWDLRS